jgi:hypothetical protein
MENQNRTLGDIKFRELLQEKITDRVSTVGKDLMEFRENFQHSAQAIIDKVSQVLNCVEEEFLQDLRQEISLMESGLRNKLEPEVRTQLESEIHQKLETEFAGRLSAARNSGAEAAMEKVDSKLSILEVALREISGQNNQVDILTCYLDKAALFAPRVALFVLKSGNLVGWQARGFEGNVNNASIKTLTFPADRESLLRKVAETRTTCKTDTSGHSEILDIVSKFGPVAPDKICVIPLVVRDKPVAVLYADSGLTPNTPIDSSSLEIVTVVVSQTVELSSARAKLGLKPTETGAASKPEVARDVRSVQSSAVYEGAVQQASPSVTQVADPGTAEYPSEATGAQPADHDEPPQQPFIPPRSEQVEAAPSVEAGSTAATASASHTSPLAEHLDESQQKWHSDARRFARLLVSEIKLYNEQKVQAGRRDKNLYSLLRDDIDKSREMYEKRVSAGVSAKVDYFYDELVRILADNQVSALGADCPGPVLLPQ